MYKMYKIICLFQLDASVKLGLGLLRRGRTQGKEILVDLGWAYPGITLVIFTPHYTVLPGTVNRALVREKSRKIIAGISHQRLVLHISVL
jgi:hypothetical protein